MKKIFKHGKTHAAVVYGKSVTEDEKWTLM
jgi:hypothetical protein